MKRIMTLAVIGLVAAWPLTVQAQGGLAVKGGVSFGNVSNVGVLPGNLGTRTGVAVGVALGGSGETVGFGVEALYAQRGVTGVNDGRKLDYIDVPVYVKANLPVPAFAPFAYAGPQVSFELKCKAVASDCPETGRPSTTYAAVIGAGVRLGLVAGMSLEGRYIYGLNDLKLNTVTSSESYKTRSFMLLMGVGF